MSITDRVKQAVATNLTELNKKDEFVKLQDFYKEMKQAGIAQKQEYSLPPLDTVGRRLRQTTANKTPR